MNSKKVGELIRVLRKEKQMTQKQLADQIKLSDKTISKWECGRGSPDISVLFELSQILQVNIEKILQGDLDMNHFVGGNMKNLSYYVCEKCANITICTGNAEVSCCGRKLEMLNPQKAEAGQKLIVEEVEDDWYITSSHSMHKDDYISFIALANQGQLRLLKQYPEWNIQLRIPRQEHGRLLWYSTKDGLRYQLI